MEDHIFLNSIKNQSELRVGGGAGRGRFLGGRLTGLKGVCGRGEKGINFQFNLLVVFCTYGITVTKSGS